MYISHKHRFVFVQLPHTGGSAIGAEIREHYGAEVILRKHSPYHEFLAVASPSEARYRVFGAIRNPMDEAVSVYFKYKTDHGEQFSRAKASGGSRSVTRRDIAAYEFIRTKDASFPEYFTHFYRVPYDNWSRLAHDRFDLALRFEHLQRDFSRMLDLVGATQIRPLPQRNVTERPEGQFGEHYTPEVIDHAKRIFGPFCERWGYPLPSDWGPVPASARLEYALLGGPRSFYWRYVRHSRGAAGRLLRRSLRLQPSRATKQSNTGSR